MRGKLSSDDQPEVTFTIPQDAASDKTIHLILEVSDQGKPSLTRYQRVIVRVEQNKKACKSMTYRLNEYQERELNPHGLTATRF